jgi:hypothetical protein
MMMGWRRIQNRPRKYPMKSSYVKSKSVDADEPARRPFHKFGKRGTEQVDTRIGDTAEFVQLKRAMFHVQVHFRRSRIARPITQSLSLSDRKLSSSVKWLMRCR